MKAKNLTQTLVLVALMLTASIHLTACGGGGGSSDSGSAPIAGASSDTSSSGDSTSGGSSGGGSPVADTTSPTIALNQPTTGTSYTASSSSVTIVGTASDNVALAQITWTNSLGGSGSVAAGGSTANMNFTVSLSSGSNVITITATDTSGNSRQYRLTVTYSPVTYGSVTLTWNAVTATNLSGYRVYYGTSSGSYQQVISAGNTTSYTLNGLTTGVRYYFVVTAVDTSGTESGYSNEAYKDVF